MKALHEINDSRDLEHQRLLLTRQLHKQEKVIDQDMLRINRHWMRLKQVGSTVSNLAMAFMPKVNVFSLGLGIFKRLIKRKK